MTVPVAGALLALSLFRSGVLTKAQARSMVDGMARPDLEATPEPRPADAERIAAAEAKRARKRAKRLALS